MSRLLLPEAMTPPARKALSAPGLSAAGYDGQNSPRKTNRRIAWPNEQLLLDEQIFSDAKPPARPGLVVEGLDAGSAVRMDHIRPVAL